MDQRAEPDKVSSYRLIRQLPFFHVNHRSDEENMPSNRLTELTPIFYPKSMAVIGASPDPQKPGGMFIAALLSFGYPGALYPVNPEVDEICGLKTYAAIRDIPGPIDLAFIGTPAPSVPGIVRECLKKGVKAVEIFTSGFRETGEAGRKLEQEIVEIAANGIRVIGPNCFGVYCPEGGITILPGKDFSKESGPVAFISQSGGLALRFTRRGQGLGIKFSKVISYGNACDIDESELLEYLRQDPETKMIAGYIEGIKDGPRFFSVLQEVSKSKPVILWKGGLTSQGAQAAMSHTGALGGEEMVWSAVLKQSGAVRVNSLEELLDTTLAFLHLAPHRGRKVGLVGGGGAIAVTAADVCEKAGLSLPSLPREVRQKLAEIVPPVGTSVLNPVDIGHPFPHPALLKGVLEIMAKEDTVDTLIVDELELATTGPHDRFASILQANLEIPVWAKKTFSKPLVMVLPVEAVTADAVETERSRRRICDYFTGEDIPVYLTLERAAKALANMVGYYEGLASK